jgi:hypothetical protein
MLSAAALPTVVVMALPRTSTSPPAGAGARDDARTDRADHDGPMEPDAGDDGFVVVPEAADASADEP